MSSHESTTVARASNKRIDRCRSSGFPLRIRNATAKRAAHATNDCAPHILSLRHRSNPLSGSERDRHPNQTENGKGKCIISSERRRPKRVGVQSKPDNRGHDKSKEHPMVRVHLRNRVQCPLHAMEKTKSREDRQAKVSDDGAINSCYSCPNDRSFLP